MKLHQNLPHLPYLSGKWNVDCTASPKSANTPFLTLTFRKKYHFGGTSSPWGLGCGHHIEKRLLFISTHLKGSLITFL